MHLSIAEMYSNSPSFIFSSLHNTQLDSAVQAAALCPISRIVSPHSTAFHRSFSSVRSFTISCLVSAPETLETPFDHGSPFHTAVHRAYFDASCLEKLVCCTLIHIGNRDDLHSAIRISHADLYFSCQLFYLALDGLFYLLRSCETVYVWYIQCRVRRSIFDGSNIPKSVC